MAAPRRSASRHTPTDAQAGWLRHGLNQPGGKLPLFDERGQRVKKPTVDACLKAGWAERWFDNPLKPDWLVCRLTGAGAAALSEEGAPAAETAAAPAIAQVAAQVEVGEDERQGALI